MTGHTDLFGRYEPQDGWLFRLAPGWKYLLLLLVTIPALVVWQWWFTLASLAVVLVLLRTSGIGFRRALDVGAMLWMVMGFLAVYQLVILRPDQSVIAPGNILLAMLASRMLTLTTSTPALLEALATGLKPLRFVGINPDHAALAVGIMLRSIPYLIGTFGQSRDAARARGRDGNVISLLIPTLVGAVAYAQTTGDALHARGIVERSEP